jgi:hypothetical protein
MKIRRPIAAAAIDASRTAAAATSLVLPARGWYSGDTRSVRNSMAVFMASALSTIPIARITRHHWVLVMWKYRPEVVTRMVEIRCMRAWICVLKKTLSPLIA